MRPLETKYAFLSLHIYNIKITLNKYISSKTKASLQVTEPSERW